MQGPRISTVRFKFLDKLAACTYNSKIWFPGIYMGRPSSDHNFMKKYLVIIPAYNEEKTVAAVISETRGDIPSSDILVVNDGSDDGTRDAAIAEGVAVINHPFNLGYGATLQTGFRFAVKKGYDFVITMDADGQHVSSSAGSLIDVMRESKADVVIGSRFTGQGYRIGILRKIGITLFSLIAKVYTGVSITDPTSGFQLINRSAFTYLAEGDNYPLDYPDVNIIMALHKSRFKVAEAPVVMQENANGKSMHNGLRPLLYVLKMCLAIIMVLLRRKDR
jgi:glycosyltransferase involved in cell wall biosynthesis